MKKQIENISTYSEYEILGRKLDDLEQLGDWKEKDESSIYDFKKL